MQVIHNSASSPDGAFYRLDCGVISVDEFAAPFGNEVSQLLGRSVSAQKLVDELKAATEGTLVPFQQMIQTVEKLKVGFV